ncbi:MAG: Hsp90 cochaperone [Cyphobasidiales sp. Tagirdzhanova-0007]|nr:MAG: Hsp90 cochaperone [Cyphobasidiales sp. Tagirdzhanova-0007]
MSADPAALAQAQKEKEAGNAAYKARDFSTAITHYTEAWETHKDITYLNNLAAAQFEAGDYDAAIKTEEDAVEQGRELRADYKLVAKAFARAGSAYERKEDLVSAVRFYNKSLAEHRTPDVLTKLKAAEKAQKEQEARAYENPELSDAARAEGNALFKGGDFAGSVKSYTEAIKRNPTDARGYTNRASAYTKLLALNEALKDADKAIEVDPTNPKGFIRKATVLFGMKEYDKAISAGEEASAKDVDKKNTQEIQREMKKILNAKFAERSSETDEQTLQRAMRDPEVQKILSDPVMMQILQEAQSNPSSLQEHLKNPDIRTKIMKLSESGVLKMR